MPGFQGRIRREDVDAVRERVHIDEVVGEYVTLKTAGVGSLKGLCPFHDERTPSFNVRPHVGLYHCFGCGESGDVYSFLMAMDHVTFAEAVERLAGRLGYQLRYEEGSGPDRAEYGKRQRLLDANLTAQVWFCEQLATPAAHVGRVFLSERGFDRDAATHFGVGFAPTGWDGLVSHLRRKGFRDQELLDAGLVSQSQQGRGVYDRFRGRLVWPIRDITGATIGFGARRLLEEDQGPKYLNTPQTRIYNKSQVLYGLDLAKRDIAKHRQAVIVEGYTDVMAMHLAGVTRAVATCGTAFGVDHVKILRRLLVDDDSRSGQIVFTFDGDAAGQKAALRAFEEENRFVAQTFVAVQPDGLDPCDLRVAEGDQALVDLVDKRQALFEFVLRATLKTFDLEQVEGRVNALRAAAPIVASIKDPSMRPQYARELAGWLGMDPEEVRRIIDREQRSRRNPGERPQRPGGREHSTTASEPQRRRAPEWNDPVTQAEGQLLGLILQFPEAAKAAGVERLTSSAFSAPAHKVVWNAVLASHGTAGDWVTTILSNAPDSVHGIVGSLAVRDLPMRKGQSPDTLAAWLVLDARKRDLLARERELDGKAQRLAASGATTQAQELFAELFQLTRERKALDG